MQSQFPPPAEGPSDGLWQSEQPIAAFACEPVLMGNWASIVALCPPFAGTHPLVV